MTYVSFRNLAIRRKNQAWIVPCCFISRGWVQGEREQWSRGYWLCDHTYFIWQWWCWWWSQYCRKECRGSVSGCAWINAVNPYDSFHDTVKTKRHECYDNDDDAIRTQSQILPNSRQMINAQQLSAHWDYYPIDLLKLLFSSQRQAAITLINDTDGRQISAFSQDLLRIRICPTGTTQCFNALAKHLPMFQWRQAKSVLYGGFSGRGKHGLQYYEHHLEGQQVRDVSKWLHIFYTSLDPNPAFQDEN